MSEGMFPTVYAVAMDYLPIQASAVPCERVFSSSSETYTKRRNCISPILMEALQMVKFSFKKERLNFTKGWAASQWAMETAMVSDNSSDELLGPVSNGPTDDSHAYDAVLKAIAEHECDDIDDEVVIYDT
jgi:hAT family C-terminal dimerisation region